MGITREIIADKIWAAGADPADKTAPLLAEILAGWPSGSKPPRQWFNWLDYVQHNNLAFFEQEGFYVWNTGIEYQKHGIVRATDNVLYISKVDTNQANNPSGGGDTVNWQTFAEFLGVGAGGGLPTGAFLTGGFDGLEVSMNSGSPNHTVDIEAGRCKDSTDSVWLVLSAATTAVAASGLNAKQFLFVCWDGTTTTMQFDTNESGSNLLAGSITHLRLRFMGKNDPSGDLIPFIFAHDTLTFSEKTKCAINSLTNAPPYCNTAIDISDWIPSVKRVVGVVIGFNSSADDKSAALGYDGTNAFTGLGVGNIASAGDEGSQAWGLINANPMPIKEANVYWGSGVAASGTATTQLLMHQIKLNF